MQPTINAVKRIPKRVKKLKILGISGRHTITLKTYSSKDLKFRVKLKKNIPRFTTRSKAGGPISISFLSGRFGVFC